MAWEWLVRDDGTRAHAFDVEGDWRIQLYLEAACQYTSPPNALHPYIPGAARFCDDCLIHVGRTLDDRMDWRPA